MVGNGLFQPLSLVLRQLFERVNLRCPEMDETNQDVPERSPDISQKKSRGKYASKACVECRNRKLKCDGTAPCTRCVRRNHRCIFSDDRAVAEILRQTRQQPATGSVNGAPSLDTRVEKLEIAMQALTERLDSEDASKSSYEEEEVAERPGFQGQCAPSRQLQATVSFMIANI